MLIFFNSPYYLLNACIPSCTRCSVMEYCESVVWSLVVASNGEFSFLRYFAVIVRDFQSSFCFI